MKFKVFSVGKIDRREALEKYLDDSDANIQSWPTADDGKALADKDGGMFTVAFVKAGTTYIAEIYSRAEAEAESLFADAFDAAGPKAKRVVLDSALDAADHFKWPGIKMDVIKGAIVDDTDEKEAAKMAGLTIKQKETNLKHENVQAVWRMSGTSKIVYMFLFADDAYYTAELFNTKDEKEFKRVFTKFLGMNNECWALVRSGALVFRAKPDSLDSAFDGSAIAAVNAKLDAITEWAESRGFEMPALDAATQDRPARSAIKVGKVTIKAVTSAKNGKQAIAKVRPGYDSFFGLDLAIDANAVAAIEDDGEGTEWAVAFQKDGTFYVATFGVTGTINDEADVAAQVDKAARAFLKNEKLDAVMTDAGDIKSPMWATSLDREYKAAMLDGVQFKKDGADVFVKGAHGVAVLDGATFVTFTNEAGETFDEQNIVLDGILGK